MEQPIALAQIPAIDIAALADDLQDKIEQARLASRDDPFGNPVLRVTLWLTRLMDSGELSIAAAGELVRLLGRQALRQRAGRLAHYVGLEQDEAAAFDAIARQQGEGATSFAAFRAAVERPRFGAVFTAHPTFGMQRGWLMRWPISLRVTKPLPARSSVSRSSASVPTGASPCRTSSSRRASPFGMRATPSTGSMPPS